MKRKKGRRKVAPTPTQEKRIVKLEDKKAPSVLS